MSLSELGRAWTPFRASEPRRRAESPPYLSRAHRHSVIGVMLTWFACAGLALTVAQAQTFTGGERQFTVLAGGEGDWQGVSYQPTPAKAVPMSFSYQRRSEVQRAGGETLVFTREIIDPATNKPMRMPVARVPWPTGVHTALLVFVPRTAPGVDGMEFDVLAVDDGFQTFPSDSVRVLNVTPATLLGRIGNHETEFKPGISPAFPIADLVVPGKTGVPLALAVRMDTSVMMLYLGPLETRPQTRSLVMVLPPKAAGSRKVRVFTIAQAMPKPTGR